MKNLVFLFLILYGTSSAQTNAPQSTWLDLNYFIGTWEGTGKGESGISTVKRKYEFTMNNKYIHVHNKSVYLPQEKNPKGEIHEDMGIISYDKNRKLYVYRQFHVEGFVNQYTLDSISQNSKKFVFTSEAIENIPKGFRARESYKIINKDEMIETFEIAEPGKDFKLYTENHLKRIITNQE